MPELPFFPGEVEPMPRGGFPDLVLQCQGDVDKQRPLRGDIFFNVIKCT